MPGATPGQPAPSVPPAGATPDPAAAAHLRAEAARFLADPQRAPHALVVTAAPFASVVGCAAISRPIGIVSGVIGCVVSMRPVVEATFQPITL